MLIWRKYMEDTLISKKELLQKYGISYGALYRWKRKGLIPEEWFIKKSAVTGQETYFDRKAICERIELIIGMKDETSLDELSQRLNPRTLDVAVLTIVSASGGTRKFRLDEIRSVILSDGKNERDITDFIVKNKGEF